LLFEELSELSQNPAEDSKRDSDDVMQSHVVKS
jgi:hypothetical protein